MPKIGNYPTGPNGRVPISSPAAPQVPEFPRTATPGEAKPAKPKRSPPAPPAPEATADGVDSLTPQNYLAFLKTDNFKFVKFLAPW